MTWLLLLGLIIVFIVAYNARRRAAKLRLRATEFQAGISKIMEIKGRPADIAIEILTRHLRTLVEKASPYIKRDDYGVLAIGSEFDSEIRYFVDRMILSDVAY